MSRPNKLARFAENSQSENVIEPLKAIYETIKGHWRSEYFKNENPITLELACGKGEYTVALAEKFREKNFIGVDLKGDRVWVGSQEARRKELSNVAFIRTRIELLPNLFEVNEVDEMWLTFPDPRPKDRDEKHRLTNINYLTMYQSILKTDGWFRFKTDNTNLFEYTLDVLKNFNTSELESTRDLYNSELIDDHFDIKTKYEKIWFEKGESIKYLKFKFA